MPTPAKKLLFCWIGDADLHAWGTVGKGPAEEVKKITRKETTAPSNSSCRLGHIKTLASRVTFDEIHLLSDKSERELLQEFATWIDKDKAKLHLVDPLADAYDHEEVFKAVSDVLQKVMKDERTCEICFHLTPGTSTMAVTWVILGKSKYNATFYRTARDKAIVAKIPFNLAVDYWTNRADDAIYGGKEIIGRSPEIQRALELVAKVAPFDVGVLVLGETGVGKELFAREIHKASSPERRAGPFEAVNCACLSKELAESHLFGHEKHAFTGADKLMNGALFRANKGTLFLDEVGELDLHVQAMLLRALQPTQGKPCTSRTFRRVGGGTDLVVDVRVIAATNHELDVQAFRDDLYYRLNQFEITIPPLRERGGDILEIAKHFLSRCNNEYKALVGFQQKNFHSETEQFIQQQTWRGNVRELENAIRSAVISADAQTTIIYPSDIKQRIRQSSTTDGTSDSGELIPKGFSLKKHILEIERTFCNRALEQEGGNKSAASRLLGYANDETFKNHLKRCGVNVPKE